ncbi:MAG TPA: hypothetical protein VGN74_05560 [Brevundimonas sp.]|jgi:hypothetical protein|uniref:hypothetical protein n=1 Tax=Brevundimonas sp. TaxID=1871086 RepID=UPI002E0D42C7|nr:hypothetical protein [Brevundimonas sp.]
MPIVSFTRPADTTAYASGDLVANSTTAGSVQRLVLRPAQEAGGSQLIRRVRLVKSTSGLTGAAFRVHFYALVPGVGLTFANGDNAAWSTNRALGYFGASDITMDRAYTDGALGIDVPLRGGEIVTPRDLDLVVALEARGAYTPGSAEVFTIDVETVEL